MYLSSSLPFSLFCFWSGHVFSSLWSNVWKVKSLKFILLSFCHSASEGTCHCIWLFVGNVMSPNHSCNLGHSVALRNVWLEVVSDGPRDRRTNIVKYWAVQTVSGQLKTQIITLVSFIASNATNFCACQLDRCQPPFRMKKSFCWTNCWIYNLCQAGPLAMPCLEKSAKCEKIIFWQMLDDFGTSWMIYV